MDILLKVVIEMFLTIGIGLILKKKRIIDDRAQQGITGLLLNAVLPCSIIGSSQYAYSAEFAKSMIAVAGASFCYYFFSLAILRKVTRMAGMEEHERRVFVQCSVFANTGFMGFPIMQAFFGGPGLMLAAVYNLMYNAFFYTYGVSRFAGKVSYRDIFLNPVTIASIGSIILFLMPFRLPEMVTESINLVGDMTFPLSMVIIGCMLSQIDFKEIFTDWRPYIVSLVRLVIFPAVMFVAVLVVRHFFDIQPVTGMTIVFITGLPVGAMNVIYAEKYNCAPRLCTRTFVVSYLLMLITIPLMLLLCTYFFMAG